MSRQFCFSQLLTRLTVGLAFVHVTTVNCLCAVESETNGAAFIVKSWQTKEGLPQNSVQAIAQTEDGYLWVGTAGGLARFDGVRFTTYGLAEGLQSLNVWALLSDGQGGLWIATRGGGLSRWQSGTISTLTTAEGLAHNEVTALAAAEPGALWIGTKGGLQHWDARGFKRVGEADLGEIEALAADRNHGVWATSAASGLFYCRGGRCEFVEGPPVQPRILSFALFVDTAGDLWVGIGNSMVLRRHGETWAVFDKSHGLPSSYVNRLMQGASGEIWAGTHEAGLFVFREGRFHPVAGNDSAIRSLLMSRDGNIWVGTRAGGLSRLSPQQLTYYPVGSGEKRGQVNGIVEEAPGYFWVSTYGGGLHRGPLNQLEHVLDGVDLGERPFFTAGLRLTNGSLCFGGSRGIYLVESGRKTSRVIKIEDTVTALAESPDGSIFVGSRAGTLSRLTNGFRQALSNASFAAPVSGLVCGARTQIWVSTLGAGLFLWSDGIINQWTASNGLPMNILNALYQDTTGTLWIGTAGGGLAWLENSHVQFIDSHRGLGDNFISQILEDEYGNLWLGCQKGIFRVSKRELRAVAAGQAAAVHPLVLDESDGMVVAECTSGYSPAGLRSQSGILYFSTVRGVVAVNPKSFNAPEAPPKVLIEEILLDGKSLEKTDHPLSLPPGTRELEIRYTAFNYFKPDQIRFRHRLNVPNGRWTEAGQRSAHFAQLPPGHHVFQVSAANQDGRWDEAGASLAFSVLPFYWQTLWFRGLAGIGLAGVGAGAVWIFVRGKLRRQQEELAHQRALNQAEQRMDLAANATELGVWERDLVKQEIWASDQWRTLFGFEKSQPLDFDDVLRRLHPEDREPVRLLLAEAIRGKKAYDMEYRIILPNGQTRWIASHARPEYDRDGKPILVRGVVLDITKRKLAEAVTRDLSGRLINAQEEERRRIARELHDDLSQRLALMAVELDMFAQKPPPAEAIAGRMETFSTEVRNLSSDVHQLAYELHPAKLDQLGLVAAARAFCKELSTAHQMAISFEVNEVPATLPPAVALGAYRIMQEALHNSVKHSAATSASVRLFSQAHYLHLIVTDDGQGFDPEAARNRGSLGILSMHERARMLGGQIILQSHPDTGTKIEVRIPLNEARVFPESI